MYGLKYTTVSAALCALTVFLGYFVQRSNFIGYFTAYSAFFILYSWVLFSEKRSGQSWVPYLLLGILLRAILLFAMPNLSDDIYRFIWDGRLTAQGIHPFSFPPSYYFEQQYWPSGLSPDLFARLNSPNFYTVYPPVCQAVFYLSAWLSPNSWWGANLCIKTFLFLCELGVLWMLCRGAGISWGGKIPSPTHFLGKKLPDFVTSGRAVVFYALNPLAVLEISGNAHFEGAMMFFLCLGLVALDRGKLWKAAGCLVLATASKLLPLMFLPTIWKWLGFKKGLYFNLYVGLFTLLLFAPMLNREILEHFAASLDLYFRKFQFNAGLYYVVRGIGIQQTGWDLGVILGPRLGIVSIGLILLLALFTRPMKGKIGIYLVDTLFISAMIQLLFSAAVHPWYLCTLLALGVFSQWRLAWCWSGVVALSYSHYMGGAFQEQFALIGLEYGLLLLGMIWVLIRRDYSFPLSPTK
jgi:alpha-1,6-mannosyltransferase